MEGREVGLWTESENFPVTHQMAAFVCHRVAILPSNEVRSRYALNVKESWWHHCYKSVSVCVSPLFSSIRLLHRTARRKYELGPRTLIYSPWISRRIFETPNSPDQGRRFVTYDNVLLLQLVQSLTRSVCGQYVWDWLCPVVP